MTGAADITVWLAFGAGLLSFLNSCTLSIFPAYLSYISGVSVKELESNESIHIRRKLLIHSIFFLIGVSLVFISLGVGVSLLGQWIKGILAGKSGLFIQQIGRAHV